MRHTAEQVREFINLSTQAITTAAERLGIDPLELAKALQNGEIAELVEAEARLNRHLNGTSSGTILAKLKGETNV